MAELVNVSPSGSLALYDRMRNLAFLEATEQAAISVSLEEGHRSFLVLKNTTDRAQSPRVLLDHDAARRPYEVPDLTIAPRQVATVDIQELRDSLLDRGPGPPDEPAEPSGTEEFVDGGTTDRFRLVDENGRVLVRRRQLVVFEREHFGPGPVHGL